MTHRTALATYRPVGNEHQASHSGTHRPALQSVAHGTTAPLMVDLTHYAQRCSRSIPCHRRTRHYSTVTNWAYLSPFSAARLNAHGANPNGRIGLPVPPRPRARPNSRINRNVIQGVRSATYVRVAKPCIYRCPPSGIATVQNTPTTHRRPMHRPSSTVLCRPGFRTPQ